MARPSRRDRLSVAEAAATRSLTSTTTVPPDQSADGPRRNAAQPFDTAAAWIESPTSVRHLFDEIDLLAVALDRDGRILFVNRALAAATGLEASAVVGRPWFEVLAPAPERARLAALSAQFEDPHDPIRYTSGLITPAGIRTVEWTTAPLRDPADRIVGSMAIGVDLTASAAARAARGRLEVAVEATADAVIITDPDGRITFVNPAFERVTGWRRDEAIGANPNILHSGRQSKAFYTAMWATLKSGRTWHGELVNKRRDGTLFTEEATITPVLATDGSLLQYIGVKRDVTVARAWQSHLDQPAIAQATMSAMIADLVPGTTPESTAEAICDRVLTLPGIVFAGLALFSHGDRVHSLAAVALDRVPIRQVDPTGPWSASDRRRARTLLRLAQAGPSIERRMPDVVSPMSDTFARLGVTALAEAPITSLRRTIGFLQVGAIGADGESRLRASLAALGAFGAVASVLLGPQLGARAQTEERQGTIRRLIDSRAFRPVFQPIVALASGATVGFEALTRFSDGTPPDAQFAAAVSSGLGVQLELATLEVALAASTTLPRDAWLAVNVSAALLEDPARLAYLLWKAGSRSIVLEITEHEAIEDYTRLRCQIDQIGLPVRLAVDDAGAGYSSLRHILELRPDIVKLDRSLVVDIDGDPVRQGLVAGLRHFASIARATVVAEGIETRAEYAVLVDLGIELGQGYLLGKPGPAREVRNHQFKASERRATQVRSGAAAADSPDIVHRVNAILWEADGTDERMTFVSEGAASVTGHAPDRWLKERRFWENHIHPDDRPAMLDAMGDAMHSAEGVSLEYRFRMSDGTYRWFEDLVEILPGDGGHTRVVGVMIDVTDRRRLEEQLAFRATHDSLTGLLNREGFQQVLVQSGLLHEGGYSAVIFLDLDEFKIVNDSLGHRAGDELLQLIGGRLRGAVRDSDAVARFGGDEFIVFATAMDERALIDLAQRLVDVIAEPSDIAGRLMAHPVSAGIAFVPPGEPPEQAIRNADLAMYVAKRCGGQRLRIFDPSMHQAAIDRFDRSSAT